MVERPPSFAEDRVAVQQRFCCIPRRAVKNYDSLVHLAKDCPPPSLKCGPLPLKLMLATVSERGVFLSASLGERLKLIQPVAGREEGFLPCCRRALARQGDAGPVARLVPHSLPSRSLASSSLERRVCTPTPAAKPSLVKTFMRVMANVS